MTFQDMALSVVVPVYNEEKSIKTVAESLNQTLEKLNLHY
jgi:glycosyltransferase involved in cell wall biosynthesis